MLEAATLKIYMIYYFKVLFDMIQKLATLFG